jgi:diguanylate cyclase (GGDEF)-like protein
MAAWVRRPEDGRRGAATNAVGKPRGRGAVPLRALVLSSCALTLPLLAQWFAPGLATDAIGVLVWLPSLVPAFLLTYYRGWRGASVAIAVGMAALTLSQVVFAARHSESPDWPLVLGLVVVLVSVSLGIGWVGELLHRAHAQSEQLALLDPLTGVPNRRHLVPYLEAAYAAAERGGTVTVVLFDVDGFRELNRTRGRPAGDDVLRGVARVVARQTPRLDLTARPGGDEFVTVLTGTTPDGAAAFVGNVRAALAQQSFPSGPVTLCAGIASHGRGVVSPDVLLAEADRALHRARESGKDQTAVWKAGGQGGRALLAVTALEGSAAGEGAVAEPWPPPARRRVDVRGHILTVDGDEGSLNETAALVHQLGFEVDLASGAEDLLARLRRRAPDIVLIDVLMPGMSGFTLADRIAAGHPGVPVLLASRYDHEALTSERRPASVVGFLRKPVDVRELGVALEHAMAGARAPSRATPLV